MEQHFHIQCHASTIPFTGHCRLSTNLNPPQILSLQMRNGGSGVWEQPAALQQLPCQPRAFGVSSQKFSSPQVGPESAGRRKTAAVSWSEPPLAGCSRVSPEGNHQTFPGFLMCFSIHWAERLASALHPAFQTGLESHGFGTQFFCCLVAFFEFYFILKILEVFHIPWLLPPSHSVSLNVHYEGRAGQLLMAWRS